MFKKIFIKKYFNLVIVSLLALVFFLATASFNYYSQSKNFVKWSSPDETANYFFAKDYALNNNLSFFDEANFRGEDFVIPRSVRSDQGVVKPVSFLGIILIYGFIAKILGIAVIPFLTPFFGALGIILFYLIIRRLFSERVALWSAFLLAAFPVYSYYSARSMFHNVLFIVLLLAGFYFFILALGPFKEKIEKINKSRVKFLNGFLSKNKCWEFLSTFLSGLFIGLAIITRSSELLWLLPAVLIIYLFYARRIGLTKLIIFLAALILALLPAAYYNQIIYGYFWHGGYNAMNSSLNNLALSGSGLIKSTWSGQFNYYRQYFNQIFKNIFYFGFNFQQSLSVFKHYICQMFPAYFWGGFLGLIILFFKNFRHFQKKYLVYILVWICISSILIFYYGSWKFNDNPDLSQFTIGNSYTRYWLPIYLGFLPLVSLTLIRLSHALVAINSKISNHVSELLALGLQILLTMALVYSSIIFVLYGSAEGLMYSYNNNKIEKINTEQVWSLTSPQAIIITRYNDKYFWPERRVIVGTLPDQGILKEVVKLLPVYPIYYYNFSLNQADIQYLNQRKLVPYGLKINLVKKINSKFSLYQLKFKTKLKETKK